MPRRNLVGDPLAPAFVCLLLVSPLCAVAQEPGPLQKAVTIRVVEQLSDKPVTSFRYRYRIAGIAGSDVDSMSEAKDVNAEDGSFEIETPASCELIVEVRAEDLERGNGKELFRGTIRTHDSAPSFIVRISRGLSVSGRVVDDVTGQPVKGARVSRPVHDGPLVYGVEEKAATTNDNGEFTVRGLDPWWGLHIDHDDYLSGSTYSKALEGLSKAIENDSREKKVDPEFDFTADVKDVLVRLKRGAVVTGRVQDQNGKPLAGVKVSDRRKKTAVSDQNGHFELRSPEQSDLQYSGEWKYRFQFDCSGFRSQILSFESPPSELMEIALKPDIEIRGRVETVDGHPVAAFQAKTSLFVSDETPEWDWGKEREFRSTDGTFSLKFQQAGRRAIGIRARGFAPWAGWLDIKEEPEVMRIVLQTGPTLTGRVKFPEGAGKDLIVKVIRKRSEHGSTDHHDPASELYSDFFESEAQVADDGSFRVPHLHPGDYELEVGGSHVSPLVQLVKIGDQDVAVDPITLSGTGRIEGRFLELASAEPVAFVGGAIKWHSGGKEFTRGFRTDQNGNFAVENSPLGEVRVVFEYSIGCFIGSYAKVATVGTDQTSHLEFRERGAVLRDHRELEKTTR